MLDDLFGMRVIVNDSICLAPNRQVPEREWHQKRSYPVRVQKKWSKRYGTHAEKVLPDGQMLGIPFARALVMNSTTLRAARERLAVQPTQESKPS